MTDLTPPFNESARQLSFVTSLKEAIAYGNLDDLADLLTGDTDVNSADGSGTTALMVAARQGRTDLVQLLIDKGADVTLRDDNGASALRHAVLSFRKDAAALLLKHGARFDAVEYRDVMLERRGGVNVSQKLDLLPLFVDAGMDIDGTDSFGNTALSSCVIFDNFPVLRWLVAHGADMEIANRTPSTPLKLAVVNGRPEMVAYLLEQGARPYEDAAGRIPMKSNSSAKADQINALLEQARLAQGTRRRNEEEAAEKAVRDAKAARYDKLRQGAPKINLKRS